MLHDFGRIFHRGLPNFDTFCFVLFCFGQPGQSDSYKWKGLYDSLSAGDERIFGKDLFYFIYN